MIIKALWGRVRVYGELLLIAALIIGVFWGYSKFNDYRIRKADLERVLSSQSSELAEALRETAKVKDQLAVVTKGSFEIRDTAHEAVVDTERVDDPRSSPPEGDNSPRLCADWTDSEGRFLFHQISRTLDVHQKFRFKTSIRHLKDGRVKFDGTLHEVSPRTGEDLSEIEYERESAIWSPIKVVPAWTFTAGYSVDTYSNGAFMGTATRHFPFNTFVTGGASRDLAFIYGGIAFTINKRR